MINDELRKYCILKRKGLVFEETEKESRKIYERLIKTDEFTDADSVLLYSAANGEVLTGDIFEAAGRLGKAVFFPRVLDRENMEFYRITSSDQLKSCHMGISEPEISEDSFTAGAGEFKKCICICPGTVFDENGNRLGYGRGYYDRYLAERSFLTKIALAYEFQIKSGLNVNEHDVSMDMIITPGRIIRRAKQ